MRTAVRIDENPALDVACWLANQHSIPLLVYHSISQDYEYASDRHHTFMLQGARDVQAQFDKAGLSYAFHLETPDDQRPHLITLSHRAIVVVTEDMPVDPPRRYLNSLRQQTKTPIVCVDTSCIAPMQLIGKAHTRAFKFRSATKDIYAERLTRDWPSIESNAKRFELSKLPFEPLDLQSASLSQLISRCEIDHSIGPIVDTCGGSTAGYLRWQDFQSERLSRYAQRRNNALLDGVSRMSPYLHYGMVSPFRIARDAAEAGNSGAEKYLDELLIWRELAYAFCFYREDHDQWSAIPEWARKSLQNHASDLRNNLYSWESLARAETHDLFWNAAQKSLLCQGELHNNVRMTWGKAILNWTATPQQALATIIDLNHRYALDGRDPASYGGILWCLGQFDRPFEPEQKIIGNVRPRPTSSHAKRLDTNNFFEKVATPRFYPVPKVAVIGAGISGLFAARTLQDLGLDVTVFEKSRGVGGRMSTRRIGDRDSDWTFDHGAQYFTARDPRFLRYVNSWIEQGLVGKWPNPSLAEDQKIVVLKHGTIESESHSVERFVAIPTMNSICKHLALDLEVRNRTRVAKVSPVNECMELFDESGNSFGKYDRLIVSTPAEQAAELLVNYPELSGKLSRVEMNPCWAAMVAFENPITDQWVGAFLHESFLSWTARNSSKPGRNRNTEHVIIHAEPAWTAEHWEHPPDDVAQIMLSEFWKVTGISPRPHNHLQAHRWKYAIPVAPSAAHCFANDSETVLSCGDWASGSRVEGAFLSGMAAAGRILGTLSPATSTRQLAKRLF